MARQPKSKMHASANLSLVESKRPILTYLQGVRASLSPAERRIADRVLADPERVITSAIATFAEDSDASVGSIIGFCRGLDLKGFAEFKIALARELAQSALPSTNSRGGGSIVERVFDYHAQCLVDTLAANPPTRFTEVSGLLQKASRIEFFSIGLSHPVAHTAATKLLLIGLTAIAHYDAHLQLISASQMGPGSVAFGISLSGTTSETVHCLEAAKARGATTICLTNAMKSPITECSDISLFATPSEIKYFQAPLASRLTQLAVIDALFVAMVSKNKNRTASRLRVSGEELIKHRLAL